MNNCLADLARLLPPSSLRKGRGRIEKTEIVELAIKHLRHLQMHPCPQGDKCEFGVVTDNQSSVRNSSPTASCSSTSSGYHSGQEEQFRFGFQECLSEAMHFLVEQEGLYAGDAMCVRLVKHLNGHCETILRDHWGNPGKIIPGFRRTLEAGVDFKKLGCSGASSSSGYHPNGSSSGSDGNGANDADGGSLQFALPVPTSTPPQHLNVDNGRHFPSALDYEAENSCSSTLFSVETSDVMSTDGKSNCRPSSKPPIPSIIGSHSSSNNGCSPVTGSIERSSDDGSANSAMSCAHRYKFKSNIKQRFTADCQTKPEDGPCYGPEGSGKSPKNGDHDVDRDGVDGASDCEEVREERISEEGAQSGDEDQMRNVHSGSSSRKSSLVNVGKPMQQISVGASTTPHLEKTAFPASLGEMKSTAIPILFPGALSGTEMDLATREAIEVKPSPEELISAMQNMSSTANGQNRQPFVISADGSALSADKGVPAFVLHEKGLFYVPLTIDKSIVSSYVTKFDPGSSPPLYPVTISVCFLMGPDKKGTLEELKESDLCGVPPEKQPADFCLPSRISPVPLPLTSGGSGSGSSIKSCRRGYRDANNFTLSRFSSQRQVARESNNSRVTGCNSAPGYNYQVPPAQPPSPGSSGSACEGIPITSVTNAGFHINSSGGGAFHSNYQDRTSPPSPTPEESLRGADSESHSGSRNDASGSSQGSSNGISRGRKRSVSSSPSMAGSSGSLGYHSWHEKSSSNSHDFFNFHANNHNLQQAIAAAHGLTANMTGGLGAIISHRHDQALTAFHMENALREKEICFNLDKRPKKPRSSDQIIKTK